MGRDLLPVKDLLFKKMLSSEQHKEVCKGFITDILHIEVKDLDFTNPYDIRTLASANTDENLLRHSEVDVRVRLKDGRQVLVEMQRRNHRAWDLRALFYPASAFVSTIGTHESGESHIQNYRMLSPTHGISVLDFRCFDQDKDALRTYTLYDKAHEQVYYEKPLGPLSLTFFELAKKPQEGQEHLTYWQMVFQGRDLPSGVPAYFTEAQAVVDRANITKEELVMLTEKEKARLDLASWIDYERHQGFKEGESRGEAKRSLEVARTALREGLPLETVQRITGIDLAALNQLRHQG